MDPNPIKSTGEMMAFVREAVEPHFLAAGFRFFERNDPRRTDGPPHLWLDYVRNHDTLVLRFDAWNAVLTLEHGGGDGGVRLIASEASRETPEDALPFALRFIAAVVNAWPIVPPDRTG